MLVSRRKALKTLDPPLKVHTFVKSLQAVQQPHCFLLHKQKIQQNSIKTAKCLHLEL